MTKRSVQMCLSAALLFGAALLVGACGDDDISSPSEGEGEGEGEGEADGGACIGKVDCTETPCEACLKSCGGVGALCRNYCTPDPCPAEGEGADPCDDPTGPNCPTRMLVDYQWFVGNWDCLEGWDCPTGPVRPITVLEWNQELGAAVHGFFLGGGILHFKKNPDTGKFETRTPLPNGVAVGQADVNSNRLELNLYQDFGGGEQVIRGIFQKQ